MSWLCSRAIEHINHKLLRTGVIGAYQPLNQIIGIGTINGPNLIFTPHLCCVIEHENATIPDRASTGRLAIGTRIFVAVMTVNS